MKDISEFYGVSSLKQKYEDWVNDNGSPQRVVWMENSVSNYGSDGLIQSTTDAFAFIYGSLQDRKTIVYAHRNDGDRQYMSKHAQGGTSGMTHEWMSKIEDGEELSFDGQSEPPAPSEKKEGFVTFNFSGINNQIARALVISTAGYEGRNITAMSMTLKDQEGPETEQWAKDLGIKYTKT